MSLLKTLALTILVSGAAMASPAVALSATVKKCGNYGVTEGQEPDANGTLKPRFTMEPIDGAGIFNITAQVSSCATARRIVRITNQVKNNPCTRYDSAGLPVGARNPCRVIGFVCRSRRSGVESSVLRCTRAGKRVVKYESGA